MRDSGEDDDADRPVVPGLRSGRGGRGGEDAHPIFVALLFLTISYHHNNDVNLIPDIRESVHGRVKYPSRKNAVCVITIIATLLTNHARNLLKSAKMLDLFKKERNIWDEKRFPDCF